MLFRPGSGFRLAPSARPGMTAAIIAARLRSRCELRRAAPPGSSDMVRDGYPRVTPSGSGRVRPDATRMSPPNAGRGFSARIHARHPRAVRMRASHLHFSNSTTGKPDRSGKSSAPGRRSVLSASKARGGEAPQSAGAERRTRGRLAVGPVPSAEGTPVHNADRRALRRFTAVISVGPRPTRSGRACLPVENCSPVVQQSSLHQGHYARRAESRGAPSVRLAKPNPRAPHPAPPNSATGWRPRMSRVVIPI